MKSKIFSLLVFLSIFLVSFGYLVMGVINYNGLTMETISFLNYYFYNFLMSDQFTMSYICSLIIMILSGVCFFIRAKKEV